MSIKTNLVVRYSANERMNHWLVAITFIMLALSGLALFHPAFFFLSNFFGGGPWTRILHPFIGVVMFVSFLSLIVKFWGHNYITDADREWQKHLGDIMANKATNLPEVGKYNIGQKYLFWSLVVIVPLLMLSGWHHSFCCFATCAGGFHRHSGHHCACICGHLDQGFNSRHDSWYCDRSLGPSPSCCLV
jgi:formate dehydrogenase subunit gamma